MPDETPDDVVPIDPEVRSVLDEFSRDPIAMAAEIVGLRAQLAEASLDAGLPPTEIVLKQPPRPPDAQPPTRFGDRAGEE